MLQCSSERRAITLGQAEKPLPRTYVYESNSGYWLEACTMLGSIVPARAAKL
jgi:hypothetical protein